MFYCNLGEMLRIAIIPLVFSVLVGFFSCFLCVLLMRIVLACLGGIGGDKHISTPFHRNTQKKTSFVRFVILATYCSFHFLFGCCGGVEVINEK